MTAEEKRQYIKDHHDKMTVKQMAAEIKCHDSLIRPILKDLGLVALSDLDILKNVIRENSGKTAQEIAALIYRTVNYVTSVAKQLGVTLKSPDKVAKTEESNELTDEQKENLNRMADYLGYGGARPREHFKESYTQTSSPYGFADNLRGIKTKS
jgi:hypothetical protein